jgi:hypothetical protein
MTWRDDARKAAPDFASLNPGYALDSFRPIRATWLNLGRRSSH